MPSGHQKNPKDTKENAKPFRLVTCIPISMYAVSRHRRMRRHLGAQTHCHGSQTVQVRPHGRLLLVSGDSTQQNAYRHPVSFMGTFTSARTYFDIPI
jgi:hypothetical protein